MKAVTLATGLETLWHLPIPDDKVQHELALQKERFEKDLALVAKALPDTGPVAQLAGETYKRYFDQCQQLIKLNGEKRDHLDRLNGYSARFSGLFGGLLSTAGEKDESLVVKRQVLLWLGLITSETARQLHRLLLQENTDVPQRLGIIHAEFKRNIQALRTLETQPEKIELLNQLTTAYEELVEVVTRLVGLEGELRQGMYGFYKMRWELSREIEKLEKASERVMEVRVTRAYITMKVGRWAVLALVVLGCGGALVTFLVMMRQVGGASRKLLRAAEAYAAGDMAHRAAVTGDQRLARVAGAMNSMADQVAQNSRELRRATEKVERINAELNEFVYIASHDLRAPLRAISNLAEWVIEDNAEQLTDGSRAHLVQIKGRTQRLSALLNELLEYSRAGRVKGQVTTFQTQPMLQEMVELLELPAGFEVLYNTEVATLTIHRTPLEQCLRNLVDNAIKHHGGKNGTIRIGCRDMGDYWIFSVADDGRGIPRDQHERIFQPYQTLETDPDTQESTGMGLAIIKKCVESFGGRVWLESEPGQGTTFLFMWPKLPEYYAGISEEEEGGGGG